MFHLKAISVVVTAAALLGCPETGRSQDGAGKTVVAGPAQVDARPVRGGVFSRGQPNGAVLKISGIEPGVWAMAISAVAPSDGEAAAVDCVLGGRGEFVEGRLVFAVEPTGGVNPGAEAPAEVTITIDGDVATVRDDGAAQRYCALHPDFSGVYPREPASPPSDPNPDADRAPATAGGDTAKAPPIAR